MDVFVANTDVTLVVPLVDDDGTALAVDSIQYRISNGALTELVPLTALAGFVGKSATATITVPAADNTLAANMASDARLIELQCLVAGNTVLLRTSYVIQANDGLVIGVNTFQSLVQAEFMARSIPNMTGWDKANHDQRVAAMIEAREHICQLNFAPMNNSKWWGQDSLNFIPDGVWQTNVTSSNSFLWAGDLAMLTADQFAKLPPMMLMALYRAQLAEADTILGGDPMSDLRHAGVMVDDVGQSKQMFRGSKPLQLPCSRRALSYLGRWITFGKRIARN